MSTTHVVAPFGTAADWILIQVKIIPVIEDLALVQINSSIGCNYVDPQDLTFHLF